MKIGILGGSFNPCHDGHLHISNMAIKKLGLNQLWWIPTKKNPLKNNHSYIDYNLRLLDCQKLTKNHYKIRVKKFDYLYSIKMIKILQNRYKNYDFYWIMGADSIKDFHLWKDYFKILMHIKITIFSRENYSNLIIKTKTFNVYKNMKSKKELPKIEIFNTKNNYNSSSKIRQQYV